ncbi:MAG: hypothetical protein V4598_12470 [Bdellovibrionota bacterium]
MKILILILMVSCAHRSPLAGKKDELVHVSLVMAQVQQSYMKGCVDAYKEFQLGPAFESCKVKAKDHRMEIESIMAQDP